MNATDPPAQRQAPTEPAWNGPPPQGNLLLLEQDDLMRWSLVMYLQRWFKVVNACTREEALRLINERSFSALVLSDQLADAEQAEEMQRLAGRGKPIPTVLMVTGSGALESGNGHVRELEKPFQLPDLARHLGIPAEK